MTVEDALPWLREHREELLESIRKEIPKPDGGVRKLGIPPVIDSIIQQAIAQQLTPIYEQQLRLPPRKKRTTGNYKGEGVRRERLHPSGSLISTRSISKPGS